MKLLYCGLCRDIFRIHMEVSRCRCGESCGRYLEDRAHAVFHGPAVPIGICNNSLGAALSRGERGGDFKAFIYGENHPAQRIKLVASADIVARARYADWDQIERRGYAVGVQDGIMED